MLLLNQLTNLKMQLIQKDNFMAKNLSRFVFLIFFILSSCTLSKKNCSEVMTILEQSVDSSSLNEFKSTELSRSSFLAIKPFLEKNLDNLGPNLECLNFLDSISSDKEIQLAHITIKFHDYINKKSYNFREFDKGLIYYLTTKEEKEEYPEKILVTKLNSHLKIGDEIKLHLLYDTHFGQKRLVFKPGLKDEYYFKLDNLFLVEGRIINLKKVAVPNDSSETLDIIIEVLVKSVEIEDVLHSQNSQLIVGSLLEIDASSYGRKIETIKP